MHRLEQFTDATFASTQENWQAIAGYEEFATEFGIQFEWFNEHRNYATDVANGSSLAYGLFGAEQTHACAVIEVINHRKGTTGLTKLLKVWITPELWPAEDHEKAIVQIFLSAIQGTIELSKRVQARTIKLYGRSNQLLKLLESLHIHISANTARLPGTATAMKGRWLEIVTT